MLEKTYSPSDFEQRQYEKWDKNGYFTAGQHPHKKPFSLMMPPPNVTGVLHMGHALTFTLQDVLIRYQRMIDRDVLWQPGTDHAGIATQIVVEKQLAEDSLSRHDLGRDQFIDRIWQWKEQSGGAITQQLRRLGASPDWSRERFTMDEGLSIAVRKVFVHLHKEGLIYRDKRLVNWDPKLHTAISDLEVESRESQGHMWYLRYPIEGDHSHFIVVATTRPETMLGDCAVAVHPDDQRYHHLIGKKVLLPFTQRLIPIIADSYSDPEKGTGAVKITPAHDFNDFDVGRRHNLPLLNIFDLNAHLNESVPEMFRGLDRFVARQKIIEALESLDLIEKIEPHLLMIPYGDRSGVIIEPWLTDQWFVDAHSLSKPVIEAVEQGRTRFIPQQWENTFFDWMHNIQPWCISRQIWWGHRIPAWYGPDGHIFVELDEKTAYQVAKDHYGRDVILEQDRDVLDTWFSSALWPFSTLGWPEKTESLERYYPTNVLVTGLDIIFFWVARMMMMGHHFMGDVPFRDVYIHALVRDAKGQKMSKSKGNVIDPLTLIDDYGCDALRFTLIALAVQGRDIKLSSQRVEGYRNFATKIWNIARFCQINECVFDKNFDPRKVQSQINRWIVSAIAKNASDIAYSLENYSFNQAALKVYAFVWGEFCDWYVEFSKPILQGEEGKEKEETQKTMAWAFEQILHLIHPFMPFISEELWQQIGSDPQQLLATRAWPNYDFSDQESTQEIEWIISLITLIRTVRREMNIPPSAKIPFIVQEITSSSERKLKIYQEIILTLGRLSQLSFDQSPSPVGALQLVYQDMTIFLPVSDIIDLQSEKKRLAKDFDKVNEEIKKIQNKLNNPDFITKAKPEVVEEQKEKLQEIQVTKDKISQALSRLS